MNLEEDIWIMYEREGAGHYVAFNKPTRLQKVSHHAVHYKKVNDAVAQKEEPPAKGECVGFESQPASPITSPNDLWKELAYDVGISVEYLTNTKQIGLIEAYAEKIVKECTDLVSYDCEAAMKKHLGLK